jgi:NAD-dependent oxidoreductase involved in siderophore biosynthesis
MVMVLKRLMLRWQETHLSLTASYAKVLATLCAKVKRYSLFYALDFMNRIEARNEVQ